MECESCHQRQATIVFTTVSGDEKQTLHLCPECSKKESERQAAGGEAQQKVQPTHVTEVKKVNVVVGHLAGADNKTAEGKTVACEGCGMTYEEFRKIGRLGCSQCYAAFGEPLRRLLKRIHGNDAHAGRGPERRVAAPVAAPAPADAESLVELREALQAAVAEEAYERAADLRDRIARLEASTP